MTPAPWLLSGVVLALTTAACSGSSKKAVEVQPTCSATQMMQAGRCVPNTRASTGGGSGGWSAGGSGGADNSNMYPSTTSPTGDPFWQTTATSTGSSTDGTIGSNTGSGFTTGSNGFTAGGGGFTAAGSGFTVGGSGFTAGGSGFTAGGTSTPTANTGVGSNTRNGTSSSTLPRPTTGSGSGGILGNGGALGTGTGLGTGGTGNTGLTTGGSGTRPTTGSGTGIGTNTGSGGTRPGTTTLGTTTNGSLPPGLTTGAGTLGSTTGLVRPNNAGPANPSPSTPAITGQTATFINAPRAADNVAPHIKMKVGLTNGRLIVYAALSHKNNVTNFRFDYSRSKKSFPGVTQDNGDYAAANVTIPVNVQFLYNNRPCRVLDAAVGFAENTFVPECN